MEYRFVAVLLIASVCGAQTPTPAPQNEPAAPPAGAITVAQGTTIALSLVNSIKSKTTKPGDTVRAVVAFPVTVGTQLAIPAGTYVEGMVNAVMAHPAHSQMPSVKIHFTRLLFANGYSAPLDAMNSNALMILPDIGAQRTYEIADVRGGAPYLGEGFAAGGGQLPPPNPVLPPLLQVGPSKAVVIGAGVGSMVAFTAIMFALGHHRANTMDFVLFDNGWQFAMVLEHPLTLDAAQVAAAAGMPGQR